MYILYCRQGRQQKDARDQQRVECVRFSAIVSTPHHPAQVNIKISLANARTHSDASTARRGKVIARANTTSKIMHAEQNNQRLTIIIGIFPRLLCSSPHQRKVYGGHGGFCRRLQRTLARQETTASALGQNTNRKKDSWSTGSPRKSCSKKNELGYLLIIIALDEISKQCEGHVHSPTSTQKNTRQKHTNKNSPSHCFPLVGVHAVFEN